jgi:hypothetical protein
VDVKKIGESFRSGTVRRLPVVSVTVPEKTFRGAAHLVPGDAPQKIGQIPDQALPEGFFRFVLQLGFARQGIQEFLRVLVLDGDSDPPVAVGAVGGAVEQREGRMFFDRVLCQRIGDPRLFVSLGQPEFGVARGQEFLLRCRVSRVQRRAARL